MMCFNCLIIVCLPACVNIHIIEWCKKVWGGCYMMTNMDTRQIIVYETHMTESQGLLPNVVVQLTYLIYF